MSNFKVFFKKYHLQIIVSSLINFSISLGLIWYFKPIEETQYSSNSEEGNNIRYI